MTSRRQLRLPGDRFVDVEVLSGVVLGLATLAALVWANVDPSGYEDLWTTAVPLDLDLRHGVNDGLMTLFFFVVGLEIKRELVDGDLRDRRTAALPVAAAVGGMVVPALIYLAVAGGDGWAVPMATDIAFALAVLAVAGSRAPRELRLFLLTLAIVDDIGAIAVIAVFYADDLEPLWLLGAAAAIGAILLFRRLGVAYVAAYALPAALLWFCTFESGVHATIAGVVLGLLTPAGAALVRLEDGLHPWSSFLVVPLFALANAGVVLADVSPSGTVFWGVVLGLVVGKPLGILGASALALRLRVGALQGSLTLRQLPGVAVIAGIGFTVALFVADLSFTGDLLGQAKAAVLTASVVAAAAGALVVRRTAGAR